MMNSSQIVPECVTISEIYVNPELLLVVLFLTYILHVVHVIRARFEYRITSLDPVRICKLYQHFNSKHSQYSTPNNMEASDIVTECKICFETYVNPKLFPCRHSICEACLKEITKRSNGAYIECPTCKTICKIDNIVHDTRLEEFIEALQEKEAILRKQEEQFSQILSNKFSHAPTTDRDAFTSYSSKQPYTPTENTITNKEPSTPKYLTKNTPPAHAHNSDTCVLPSAPPPESEVLAVSSALCDLCEANLDEFWCVNCEQKLCAMCKRIHLRAKSSKDHFVKDMRDSMDKVRFESTPEKRDDIEEHCTHNLDITIAPFHGHTLSKTKKRGKIRYNDPTKTKRGIGGLVKSSTHLAKVSRSIFTRNLSHLSSV